MNKFIIKNGINNITINNETDYYIDLSSTLNSEVIMDISSTVNIYINNNTVNSKISFIYNITGTSNINVYFLSYSKDLLVRTFVNLNNEYSEFTLNNRIINESECKFLYDIHHNAKNTNSFISNNGINTNKGTTVIDIIGNVENGITGCRLEQQNRIINYTKGKVEVNPILLIEESDVIAEHSAYIGAFLDSDLFYLRSRGLSKNDATALMLVGLLSNTHINNSEEIKSILGGVKYE